MSPIPQSVITQLVNDAEKDPHLPPPHPTESFWQEPPSPISNLQSPTLSSKTTYAIIGAGITGTSVTKTLLSNLPSTSTESITVLEARSLCSGATGRNGGHLLSPFSEEFVRVEEYLGLEETIKIARFANRTLETMYAVAEEWEDVKREAEVRRVRSVCAYYDEEEFENAKRSNGRYEEFLPEWKGDAEVFDGREGLKTFGMKDAVGVITSRGGAFWPYRLVTGVLNQLVKDFEGRLFIESNTPVTAVEYDPASDEEHPYRIKTPRGSIRAAKVIHCSNGWTGHLLPNLRGKIFPIRGTMSVQAASEAFANEGDKKSWSTIGKPAYDAKDGTFSYGLYYITQNTKTGDIFIGGEKQLTTEVISADDTQISAVSQDHLVNVLPKIFANGWEQGESPDVKKVWSGIMGFTPDNLPWVGQIPESITGRSGDGEYIAAGFNGYGMPLCWGCGEAVAKMLLGKHEEVEEWLPRSFLMSRERLSSPFLETEAGIWSFLMQDPGDCDKECGLEDL